MGTREQRQSVGHAWRNRHSLLSSVRILSHKPQTIIAKRVSPKYLEKNVSDFKKIWGNDRFLARQREKFLWAGGGRFGEILSCSCGSALPVLLPLPLGPPPPHPRGPLHPCLSPPLSSSRPIDIPGKPFGEDPAGPSRTPTLGGLSRRPYATL